MHWVIDLTWCLFCDFLIKNLRIRPTNEGNSNTVLVLFSTLSTGCGLCGPRVLRAIQDSSSSAAASSSDSNGGRAGAGTGNRSNNIFFRCFSFLPTWFFPGVYTSLFFIIAPPDLTPPREPDIILRLSLDTCLCREIRYFRHTYQSRFTMLLQCNTALNRRISLEAK